MDCLTKSLDLLEPGLRGRETLRVSAVWERWWLQAPAFCLGRERASLVVVVVRHHH